MDIVTVIIMVAFILSISTLLFLWKFQNKKQSTKETIRKAAKGNGKDWLRPIFLFYKYMPGFNRIFAKVKTSVKILYPTDILSENKIVSKILVKATLRAIICTAIVVFFSFGDKIYMVVGLVMVYVVYSSYINGMLTKAERTILIQFRDYITKVMNVYHDKPIVEFAIHEAMNECPFEMRLHAQTIYEILVDPNMKMALDAYVGKQPNDYMLTFLQVCAEIKDHGDKKLKNGTTLFANDVNFIKEQVDNEIIDMEKIQDAFRGHPWMCIVPIFAIKPLSIWLSYFIPQLKPTFAGIYGTVALILMFVGGIFSYNMVLLNRDGVRAQSKENSIFAKIGDAPELTKILNRVINKRYTTYVSYNEILKGTGDFTGIKAFIVKRYCIAAAAVVIALLVFTTATIQTSMSALSDFKSDFADSVVPSEEYRQTMEFMAKEYANNIYLSGNHTVSRDEIAAEIRKNSNITRENNILEIIDSIENHIEKKEGAYFKWWYLIVAIICGFIGYQIPLYQLKRQKVITDMRREDEIIQFQSIILILMHITGTSLASLLESMERFSFCFKESLAQCRMNLSSGQQKAIEQMRNAERYEPFKNLCEQLKCIDKVGVENAFDSIESDRLFSLRTHEYVKKRNLTKRSSSSKRWAFVSFFMVVFLVLIIPMGIFIAQYLAELAKAF